MLPRPDLAVLAANPRFEALYHDLCSNKLNPDGTTKLDLKAQRESEGLAEQVRQYTLDAYKRAIVQRKLEEVVLGDGLPEGLNELVALAAATLGDGIPSQDRELVTAELRRLQDHSHHLATQLSRRLTQDLARLSRLLPDQDADLSTAIGRTQASVAARRAALAATTRQTLPAQLASLHALHRAILSTAIRALEQTLHGALSRHTRARAEYLAAVAAGMAAKSRVQERRVQQATYSAALQDVLRGRVEAWTREEAEVRRKVREAEARVEAFGREKGMEGLLAEYKDLLVERRRVREEVRRLEEGRGGGAEALGGGSESR